jgi:hypothetical protein
LREDSLCARKNNTLDSKSHTMEIISFSSEKTKATARENIESARAEIL